MAILSMFEIWKGTKILRVQEKTNSETSEIFVAAGREA